MKGVQEPEYVREEVVIPTLAHVKQALTVASEDLALEIVMMAGCGLRNGEARAVNINSLVADDVYRVHEQIHSNTHPPAKLKHRKAGGFPAARAERVLHRTDGTPPSTGSSKGHRWWTGWGCTAFATTSPPTPWAAASPLPTWPSGWVHKWIEETYRTYRHLMPGSITKAARILDTGPWDAA
ncbi:hypothetical protein ACWEBX_32135 [Streptomyces sp. NPDC005070]